MNGRTILRWCWYLYLLSIWIEMGHWQGFNEPFFGWPLMGLILWSLIFIEIGVSIGEKWPPEE